MQSVSHLKLYEQTDLKQLTSIRSGEIKLGEELSSLEGINLKVQLKSLRSILADKVARGVRYAILGIPEDIGPRANLGRAGSNGAWIAFLSSFLNIQSNQFLDPSSIIVIGEVELSDLQSRAAAYNPANSAELNGLRELCAEVDARVAPIVETLVASGLEPIVIGGGHNNCFPIQQAVFAARTDLGLTPELACINCDPHADFRAIEGRHSGNGFRYAYQAGILKAYYVLGLHESYNSAALLQALKEAGFEYSSFEDIKIRGTLDWQKAISLGCEYLSQRAAGLAVGLEVDLDSIAWLPTSAETPTGISTAEAGAFVYAVASSIKDLAYLHIPEGAPALHPIRPLGDRYVGRAISTLVTSYIKAREAL